MQFYPTMKTNIILIVFLLTGMVLNAQEFSFGVSHTSARSTQFSKPVGIYVDYSYAINQKMKWNIGVLANFSYQAYDRITFNNNTGNSYLVDKVQPQSSWFSLSSSLNFDIFSRGCLIVWVGPQISINYFICNEVVQQIPTGVQEDRTYRDKHNYLNRIGAGGICEFELKGLFRKKISIILSFSPQIIVFGKPLDKTSNIDRTILANISRLGLRYNF
jgi:hypothetical protein